MRDIPSSASLLLGSSARYFVRGRETNSLGSRHTGSADHRTPSSTSVSASLRRERRKADRIGGTGLIGSKVVEKLRTQGHEAVAAAPSTGVNTVTGEGLADVLKSASVVADLSNSPSFEEKAAMAFFRTSTGNLLAYEARAGVRHHVALSVVGADRLRETPYMRAKILQETLIKESGIPYSIVHVTQFLRVLEADRR
jgi:hypothetical protein